MHLLTLLALGTPALSAAPAPVHVVRAEGAIEVDGVLDEADWSRAVPVTDFVRYTPAAGGAPSGSTEVRFLQDARTLYVGVTVADTDYRIRARVSPREELNADDQVGIYLDTFGDERTGYIFYFNALGIQQDIRFNNGDWNPNWNTVLWSKGRATDSGYTVEIAIPFRSIRYPDAPGPQTWGVILTRKIPSEGAKYGYPTLDRAHPRLFSQAAPLVGVEPASRGAGLELLPSLALRQDAARDAAGEPLQWSGLDPWQEAIRPGVDLRLGLGPNAGLAGTVNPDFSQVEGDEAQINLNQRYAFYLTERRPFFLDGIDAFQDAQDTLYTRSITDPIYGLKLSGRRGATTVGLLQALDRAPAASVNEAGTPGFSEDALAGARASDAYGRARIDAFDGGYVGLTAADKRILETGASNDVLGSDAVVPLGETWTGEAVLAGSRTEGEGQTLLGHSSSLELRRAVSTGWWGGASVRDSGPDYRDELGFLTQSGVRQGGLESGYTVEPSADWLDRVSLGVWGSALQERDGDRLRSVGIYQSGSLGGVHKPASWLELNDERQGGVDFLGGSGGLEYRVEPARFLKFTLRGQGTSALDYALLLPAMGWDLTADVSVRIGAGVRVDTSVIQAWFTPEALATQAATAIRSRAFWQFTPTWGARIIGQTTTGSGVDAQSLETSYLLTWLRNPGTEAYLGATQIFSLDGRSAPLEQTLFAKLTWLFRV